MIHAIAQEGEDQHSWLSSSQQDPLPNINQQPLEDYNYSNTFFGFEFWANYKLSLSMSDVKDIVDNLDICVLCHFGGTN